MMHSLYAQNNDYVAYINKYKDIAIEQMNKEIDLKSIK